MQSRFYNSFILTPEGFNNIKLYDIFMQSRFYNNFILTPKGFNISNPG